MKTRQLLETLAEIRQAEKSLKKQREIIQAEIMALPEFIAGPLDFSAEYMDLISVRAIDQPIRDFPWNTFRDMSPHRDDIIACTLKLRYSPEIIEAAKPMDIIASTEWADEWGIIDLPGQIARKHGLQPETSYQLVQKRSKQNDQ